MQFNNPASTKNETQKYDNSTRKKINRPLAIVATRINERSNGLLVIGGSVQTERPTKFYSRYDQRVQNRRTNDLCCAGQYNTYISPTLGRWRRGGQRKFHEYIGKRWERRGWSVLM